MATKDGLPLTPASEPRQRMNQYGCQFGCVGRKYSNQHSRRQHYRRHHKEQLAALLKFRRNTRNVGDDLRGLQPIAAMGLSESEDFPDDIIQAAAQHAQAQAEQQEPADPQDVNDFVYFLHTVREKESSKKQGKRTGDNANGTPGTDSPKSDDPAQEKGTSPQASPNHGKPPKRGKKAARKDTSENVKRQRLHSTASIVSHASTHSAHPDMPPPPLPLHQQVPVGSAPRPSPDMAPTYVPRETALSAVIAQCVLGAMSGSDIEEYVRTHHSALYEPYSISRLIQLHLLIAQNISRGAQFVAAGGSEGSGGGLSPPPAGYVYSQQHPGVAHDPTMYGRSPSPGWAPYGQQQPPPAQQPAVDDWSRQQGQAPPAQAPAQTTPQQPAAQQAGQWQQY